MKYPGPAWGPGYEKDPIRCFVGSRRTFIMQNNTSD